MDKDKYSIVNAKKKKDFLLCIDSDGCVFDTMNSKHKLCFAPLLIKEFCLDEHYDELFDFWQELNLYTSLRGVNRFKGAGIFLNYVLDKNYMQLSKREQVFFDEYIVWTETAKALSNAGLENFIREREENEIAKKILIWSNNVNKKISSLTSEEKKLFNNAATCLKLMNKYADIAVVSSANKVEIFSEWQHADILRYVQTVCTQEDGSKKSSIKKLLSLSYKAENVLCIGDAISDMLVAQSVNCLFYPVIPDSEKESWQLLKEKYFMLFLKKNYSIEVEFELQKRLKTKLPQFSKLR